MRETHRISPGLRLTRRLMRAAINVHRKSVPGGSTRRRRQRLTVLRLDPVGASGLAERRLRLFGAKRRHRLISVRRNSNRYTTRLGAER